MVRPFRRNVANGVFDAGEAREASLDRIFCVSRFGEGGESLAGAMVHFR